MITGTCFIQKTLSVLFCLHTKSSSMFHAVFFLRIVPAKMEKPDNEDIIIQIEETHLISDQSEPDLGLRSGGYNIINK
jgi:hypothetical protein